MNVEFYTAHVKTLKDLQEIAEKHNCTINFGFRNSSQPDKADIKMVEFIVVVWLSSFFGDLVCDYLKEPRIERSY